MLHLSLRYRIPRIKPIGEVFERHCQFKHVTREQSRFSFNDIEITSADDGKIPSELGIQDKDTLKWCPLVDLTASDEPEEVVTEDAVMEEGEEAPVYGTPTYEERYPLMVVSRTAAEEEAPIVLTDTEDEEEEEGVIVLTDDEEEEAAPIGPFTDVYECIDEYYQISEEAEQYLSEVDCYRKIIRVDIEGFADGECWR